jgi:broad specificity phosphatase PhoE
MTGGYDNMTRIILVRHCEAKGNTYRILQGRTDCDISGNSAAQLDLVSLRLRNTHIDAIYSSPLKRARKTAEAINRYHGLPVKTDARLQEIDVGEWEGKTWSEIERDYPEMAKVWKENPGAFVSPNGESMKEVYDRIWNGIIDIVKHNEGKTVLVTSHGCAIRNFLCRALGKTPDGLSDIEWCDNTAVSVIDFDGALKPKVVVMNDASHLPASLSLHKQGVMYENGV